MTLRVAAITGAGRGIGRAVAQHFGRSGMAVVVNDLGTAVDGEGTDSTVADTAVDELRAHGVPAVAHGRSIAAPGGAEELIELAQATFGRLDVLVNNAGIMRDAPIESMDDEEWDAVLSVNLTGAFRCCRAAARAMKQQGGGKIINVSSINGLGLSVNTGRVAPGRANYAASKAGLLGLTWALAHELRRASITCNAVLPTASTRLMRLAIESRKATGRPGVHDHGGDHHDPDAVARIIDGLVASEVTGLVVHVDGSDVSLYAPERVASLSIPPEADASTVARILANSARRP